MSGQQHFFFRQRSLHTTSGRLGFGAYVLPTLSRVNLSSGLVNGSTGIIVDFIYTNTVPPEFSAFLIIDFPNYTCPAFFNAEDRKTWVPLPPSTAEWYAENSVKHSRTQFPIQLAWALTTWKAQGMTISGKVFAPFAVSVKNLLN